MYSMYIHFLIYIYIYIYLQKDIDVQYKGLRKIVKLLKEADEQLAKSKNHKAMEALGEALSAMKGMDVSSGMFRCVCVS
jgi:hypothetical protein